MNIYEVIPTFDGDRGQRIDSSVVIAKSKNDAVKAVVDYWNNYYGFEHYFIDDFVANDPIDPNDYQETTVIN